MVQSSIIAITLISGLSGLVAAGNCRSGGIYCGSDLIPRASWYITDIDTGLAAESVAATSFNENNSLWTCSDHGNIQYMEICTNGCLWNGSKDDSCQVDSDAASDAADAAGDADEAAAAAKRDVIGKEWAA